MANRGMSNAMLSEIAKDAVHLIHLVRIELDTPINATDAHKVITADLAENAGVQNYSDQGFLLSLPDITETVNITCDSINIVMGFAEQTVAQQLLSASPINKKVNIHLGFLDSAGALIADPLWLYSGMIDTFNMVDDTETGASVISISVSNHWSDFERRNGFRTNNAHQQSARYYPGDAGFEYCSQIIKELKWGAPD